LEQLGQGGAMTSRLKHKLELENINLKSAYLNESFVQVRRPHIRGVISVNYQIGTPLPALADHKKDKLEYLPEWQQEASSLIILDPAK
jgi:G patch domain-containing protein 1